MEHPPEKPQQPPHHEQPALDTDLRDTMESFGAFWNRYGNIVMITITVIVVAFAGYRFFTERARQAHEAAFAELASTTSPEGLGAVALGRDNPAVRAIARLRQGDLLLQEAISPDSAADQASNDSTNTDGADAPDAAESTDAGDADQPDRENTLRSAATAYQQVIDQSDQPVFRVNALLGLAAVAETQHQWDQARDHYKAAIDEADDRLPTLRQRAQSRLDVLGELGSPIAFAPEPPASAQSQNPSPDNPAAGAIPPGLLQQLQSGAAPNAGESANTSDDAGDAQTPESSQTPANPQPSAPSSAPATDQPATPADGQ